MSEPIIKAFDGIDIKGFNDDERSFWITASVEITDRDMDIMEIKGGDLKNFKKNPVFLYAHDYSGLPIGKIAEIEKVDNKLRIKPVFAPASINPFAEQVYQSYRGGFLKAVSIGFIPLEWVPNEIKSSEGATGPGMGSGRRYKKWELLEVSACPVPSNPGALAELRALGQQHKADADFMLKLKNQLDTLVKLMEKEDKGKQEPAPEKPKGEPLEVKDIKDDPVIKNIIERLDALESSHNDPEDKQPEPEPSVKQPAPVPEVKPAVKVLTIGKDDLPMIVESMIGGQVRRLQGKI